MSWKNICIRILVWLLKPVETQSKDQLDSKNFLIVSTTGLDNTLWATPAIRALRKTYPDALISLLTSPTGAQVLKHNPHINDTYVLGKTTLFSLLYLLPKLRRMQFSAVLIFHASQRMIFPFCALIEAEEIIGTANMNKGLDFLLTTTLEKKYQHEIDRRFDIIRQVGAYVNNFHLEIIIRQSDEDKVSRFLAAHGVPDHIPLVGIHLGSHNLFKQWPKEIFIDVAKRLIQHLGCQVFVIGDQAEAIPVLGISSKIPNAIPVAGELNFASLTALFKKMDLMITNDTGTMQLAFAAKAPTVALFGLTDASLCGPYSFENNIKILKVSKVCLPCLDKNCTQPFCLLQLGPEAIYDASLSIHRSYVR